MERTSEHRKLDETLRTDYINQVSLDEFLLSKYPEVSDVKERLALATQLAEVMPGNTPEQIAESMLETVSVEWAKTLYPDTTLNEILYLQGKTDIVERAARVSQWNQEHEGSGKEVPEIKY